MASAKFAWGIDVGNRALKAVKLVREGDGVRIDDFEVIEHETVLSNAGDNREQLITTALASFVQRHPMKGGFVGVGVSGQSSFARFIKLPPVEPKKIPEIVRFEAIQQIPFPLDDVEWSYQLFQHPESPDIEVGIFAMRKELVNQHIKYFTDFDLNVQVVQMNPLAVYNALQHDGRFDSGTTMIIDLGAENTDLLIADNETIWMRSIPIGGNNFTETLVKAFKLPFAKAEELKRNAATSKYARQIFQAMRPIFADLVAEIQRSVGFYASVHRDSRIKKVLSLGGTFRLPGLQKYLQQNLQMDVERLDSLGAGAPADPKLVPTFNENMLSVVSAYGLALQALGDTKVTSSLLPAKIRREKMWKEKTKWFAAAAALFVVGTGLVAAKWLFLDFQQTNNHNSYSPKIEAVKGPAMAQDQQWSTIEGAGGEDRTKVADLRKLDAYREMWRNFTVDLYTALPMPPKEIVGGDPTQVKKIPRSKRKMILINNWTTRYVPEAQLEQIVKAPDFARYADGSGQNLNAPPAGDPGAAAPASPESAALGNGVISPTSRGFLITLRCTTPYDAALDPGGLIEKEFVGKLMNIKPDASHPKMEYAVARVAQVQARRVKMNPERLAKLKLEFEAAARAVEMQQNKANGGQPTAPDGQPGVQPGGVQGGPVGAPPSVFRPNPGMVPPAGGAAVVDAEAYKDPVLGESVIDDWEFTLLIAVTLDPPVPAAAAPAPGSSADAR
ncbi:MAG: type IV pilus assembly protein PilM [Anaerolineae bacterium]|nr:type IV pilus assembly protein PilM [Phycisphaerae bacterium]